MDELIVNGTTYLKASVAARNAGYTSDYVGQLCRGKKIDARLVGRTWYVNPDELGVHQVEKRRMARVKAREQVRKSIAEHTASKTKKLEARPLAYETDDSELIPAVRKVVPTVEIEKRDKRYLEQYVAKGDDFAIENKGDSVIMSGDLEIVDAEEDVGHDDDSIILKPKILKHDPKVKSHDEYTDEVHAIEALIPVEAVSPTDPQNPTDAIVTDTARAADTYNFMDRLASEGVLVTIPENDLSIVSETAPSVQKSGGWLISFSIVLVGAVVSFSLLVTMAVLEVSMSDDGMILLDSTYKFDLQNIKKIVDK